MNRSVFLHWSIADLGIDFVIIIFEH